MRFRDVAGLALSSLWQQRGRSLLTLIGVMVGATILLFSLAAQQGVQEAVLRVFSEGDELRHIQIWASYNAPETAAPADEVEPKREMSAAKRERIRKMAIRNWQRLHQGEQRGITRTRLTQLDAMPHVARVLPGVTGFGWVILGGKELEASFVGVPTENDELVKRIVAGAAFPSDEDGGAIIHEFLAYEWGYVTDQELKKLVGQTMRIEFRYRAEAVANLLAFRAGQQMKLTPEEIKSLNRALDRLPAFIDAAPLEEDQRAVMKKVFPQAGATPVENTSRIISQEFKIRGVFRAPSEEEERTGASISPFHPDALVLLPSRTAADFYFDRLDDGGYGLSQATVIVDNEQNLAQVSERLRDLGYSEYSLIQLVERIRKYVKIVTWVFAGVACVALFVAAVGITNTMIMSVIERTHEIGVMKSVGARDSHILSVFVLEGALLGFVGSVAAIALSWCLSFAIDWIIRWILEQEIQRSFERQTALLFPWWVVAAVIAICSLVTILAAIVPARRAARISPIAALRHD